MHFSRWLWSDRKSLYMWASFWNLKKKNEHQEYLNISVIQFFAALGLAFIIKLVFLLISEFSNLYCILQFSGLLVFLMLRAFDCDAFPNCWFPPNGHEAHIQKQSKFSCLWGKNYWYDNLETILSDLSHDIKQTGSKTGKSLAHLLDESIEDWILMN